MPPLLPLGIDGLIFILLPWLVWRALKRSIPLAVLPILIGLAIAAAGVPVADLGVPSSLGNTIGFAGVLVLAFAAGLEMRQSPDASATVHTLPQHRLSVSRMAGSAAAALALPFIAGTLAARYHFLELPGWASPRGDGWLGAVAIGLCIAVSALPVLIGLVRELRPCERPLGQIALGVAVIDDAVLWVGLALLLLAANGDGLNGWDGSELIAVGLLGALALTGVTAARRDPTPPVWLLWPIAALWLAAGSWASSRLGLHALLGAYFAGATMAPNWAARLPVERVGLVALFGFAPLFFGHSGLRIDGDALTWSSLVASVGLLALSVISKLVSVLFFPPSATLSRREALAVGALLQCKGLMEIVAATILRDQGLLSEFAYAALVTLAVLSTTFTGPLFRACLRRRGVKLAEAGPDCPRAGQ